jgi:hypothetical protein
MTSHHVYSFDEDLIVLRIDTSDRSGFSLIFSGSDDDFIFCVDFHTVGVKLLHDFWSKRDNLLVTSSLQFSEDWTKDTSSFWLEFIIDDHASIIIRSDI